MSLNEADITSDLILRAFEVTGLRPVARTCYANPRVASPCGCAIGALALAFEVLDSASYSVATKTAVDALGLSQECGRSIADGFDAAMRGWWTAQPLDPLYRAGYDAGRVLRERAAVAK